jgi:NodT family efflux transporter outer membrane factor (OMF) lipoprotein
MSRMTLITIVLLLLSLGGCTSPCEYITNGFKVGPNYLRPPAPVAKSWIDAADVRVRSECDDLSKWWTVFNDPILNSLICDAYRQNITLREAGFRVLEARAQLGIAIGEIFPQQQVMSGSYSRKEVSLAVPNRVATPTRSFSTWVYGFGLAWELDFWGRFRRAIEAADDTLEASVEDYDDVLVTLLGDVAADYVQLRTLQKQLEFLRTNAALQKEILRIARAKFEGGQVSELDVDQAEGTLELTLSQIPQLEIQIRQLANALCVLLGIPVENILARIGEGPIPTAPPTVAVGAPADLLRRRPDVRREERRAAAQCAQIGVAEADFYPAISIVGQVGWAAQTIPTLFHGQAFEGVIGPSFQWNILNYGRILNNVLLQNDKFQEQIAKYQQTVLNADGEVENGIITYLKSHESAQAALAATKAGEKAVNIALTQYKAGQTDFNRVALLEQNLVNYQNELAQTQGEIALGLIQVYKALGGGWEIRVTGCDSPPSPSSELQVLPEHMGPAPRPVAPPVSGLYLLQVNDSKANDTRAQLGQPTAR